MSQITARCRYRSSSREKKKKTVDESDREENYFVRRNKERAPPDRFTPLFLLQPDLAGGPAAWSGPASTRWRRFEANTLNHVGALR